MTDGGFRPLLDYGLEQAFADADELDVMMGLSPLGIVFSVDKTIVKASRSAAEIVGYDSDDLVGLSFAPTFVSEETFAGIEGAMCGAFLRKLPFQTELQIQRQDKSLLWCRIVGYSIVDRNIGCDAIWFLEDFSEDRLMLDALDRSTRELVAIFDAVQIGIVVIRGSQVARCNQYAETLLGYEPGTLPGTVTRRFMEMDAETEAGRIEIGADGALADGFAAFGDQRLHRRDGSFFWGRLTGRALDPRHPGRASVWIIEDVTERHEAERALLAARDELERRVWERTAELVESNTRLLAEMAERKQSEQRVWHMAHHDALTGLPNRLLLQERLMQTLATAQRNKHRVAVLFIDLDRFKGINDSLGHSIGDLLLQEVANRLQRAVRNVDTVARLGGDEFVVILQEIHERDHILLVIDKIIDTLSCPVLVSGHELTVTPSIGVSVYPDDGTDADHLMQNADTAMYKAKARGRNTFQFFMTWMNDEATRTFTLEHRLRNALDRKQLEVFYQPQIDFDLGGVSGVEALLRWTDAEKGEIAPVEFIPIAEDTGLILPIGEWVLYESMRQNRRWQEAGFAPLPVSVNLSPRQFRDKDLVATVRAILRDTQQHPSLLELEITESTLIHDVDEVLAKLTELASMGVKLAIDDFGTGYSSLSYLKRFPVHKLKVDRSFVRDVCSDCDAAAIVSAMVGLGRTLGLSVLAEGVETSGQLALLRAYGCAMFQGNYFAAALPVTDAGAIFSPPAVAQMRA